MMKYDIRKFISAAPLSFSERFHFLPDAARARYRALKLRKLLGLASTAPVYRSLWKNRRPADLHEVPVAARADIQGFWPYGVKTILPWDRVSREITAGVTDAPLEFYVDIKFSPRRAALFQEAVLWSGADRSAEKLSLSPPTRCMHPYGYDETIRDMNFPGLSATGDHKSISDALNASRAQVLMGYPAHVHGFLEAVRAGKIPAPRPGRFASVLLYGELPSDVLRREISEILGLESFGFYELAECGIVGIECEAHRGYHLDESAHIVEIVDDAGSILGNGESGRIVITTFLNEVAPFICYDTGDRGFLREGACKCGRLSQVLVVEGRTSDHAPLSAGHPYTLAEIRSELIKRGLLPGSYQIRALPAKSPELAVFPAFRNVDLEGFDRIFPGIKIVRNREPVSVMRAKVPAVLRHRALYTGELGWWSYLA